MTASSQISRAELREATLTGARWNALARVALEVVAFASSVVLARLISPAEFGRAAIALALAALALSFTGEGVGSALVQRRDVQAGHLRAAVLVSLTLGAGLTALTYLLAPIAGDRLFGQRAGELLQLVAPVFLLTSLGAVPRALLQRELDFRRLSLAEVTARFAGVLAAVGLAVAGVDAEALVAGTLVTSAGTALLLLARTPVILPGWHPREMAELSRYGIPAALSSLSYVGYRNVDYAILGAKLSAAQVGFYWRAFQLGAEYQGKISGIMLKLAFPVFSRTQSVQDMRAVRRRIVRLHCAIIFPLLLLYIALAPELVPWLFGERWRPAVVLSQLLAVSGLAYAVNTGVGALALATGRPRSLLAMNTVALVLYAAVVFVAADHGLVAVCVSAAVLNVGLTIAYQYFIAQRLAGIPLGDLWADVRPATVAGAALLAVSIPCAVLSADAPTLLALGVVTTLGTLAYLATLRALFHGEWEDLHLLAVRIVRPSGGRSRPAG